MMPRSRPTGTVVFVVREGGRRGRWVEDTEGGGVGGHGERGREALDVPRAGGIIGAARGKPPGGASCAAAGVRQERWCLSIGR